ncbi:MAG: SDR family NAD(P)-dependent oxidoreductase [Xanthomonadales bacterium]|nr:SDR family NAD(P)-dependent oxidoreductase [Xanthomonadales bacterium]
MAESAFSNREQSALVIGGGAIASAIARKWLSHHTAGRLQLITRNTQHWRQHNSWSQQYAHLQLIQADVLDDTQWPQAVTQIDGGLDGQAPLRFAFIGTGVLHQDQYQPERQLNQLDSAWMLHNFRVNTLLPARVISHLSTRFPKHGPYLLAALSARVGSIGDNRLGGWYSYRASKAALNQFIHTAAIELKRQNPASICVSLHPGTVDSALSQPFQARVPAQQLFSAEHSAHCLWQVMTGLSPQQSGGFYAWNGQAIDW